MYKVAVGFDMPITSSLPKVYPGPYPSFQPPLIAASTVRAGLNPSCLSDPCLLLKHASPALCPKTSQLFILVCFSVGFEGGQSRLYAYRHAHPFSRATQQSLRPGRDPACHPGAPRVRAQRRGEVLGASSGCCALRPAGSPGIVQGRNTLHSPGPRFALPVRVSP